MRHENWARGAGCLLGSYKADVSVQLRAGPPKHVSRVEYDQPVEKLLMMLTERLIRVEKISLVAAAAIASQSVMINVSLRDRYGCGACGRIATHEHGELGTMLCDHCLARLVVEQGKTELHPSPWREMRYAEQVRQLNTHIDVLKESGFVEEGELH